MMVRGDIPTQEGHPHVGTDIFINFRLLNICVNIFIIPVMKGKCDMMSCVKQYASVNNRTNGLIRPVSLCSQPWLTPVFTYFHSFTL